MFFLSLIEARQGVPVPLSHKWPLAFHCRSQFTGNNFGLNAQLKDNRNLKEIGEPTYVGINLVGHYYYDFNGHRECNIWYFSLMSFSLLIKPICLSIIYFRNDFHSNIVTRTMITNGHFYYIQSSTGVCTIVPFTPKGIFERT